MTPLIHNLYVLSYAGGHTLWLFNAMARGDTLTNVLSPDYFAPARDIIRPGDHISVSAIDGAAQLVMAPRGHMVVLSRASYEV